MTVFKMIVLLNHVQEWSVHIQIDRYAIIPNARRENIATVQEVIVKILIQARVCAKIVVLGGIGMIAVLETGVAAMTMPQIIGVMLVVILAWKESGSQITVQITCTTAMNTRTTVPNAYPPWIAGLGVERYAQPTVYAVHAAAGATA